VAAPLEPFSGTKTISQANTPERLSTTSRVVTGLAVVPRSGGPVYIGDESVDSNGWVIGRGIALSGIDLARVYVYGPAGASVRFIATGVTN
jgi:hypothetical protein